QDLAQSRLRFRLKLRKRERLRVLCDLIEAQLDLTARCGDHCQPPARGGLGALECDRGFEEFLAAVDTQHAVAPEQLVVHAVWSRERTGVHGRKLLPRLAAPRFED